MSKKILSIFSVLLIVFSIFYFVVRDSPRGPASDTTSGEMSVLYDKFTRFATLSPHVQIEEPVLKQNNDSEYLTEVFKILMDEADKTSERFAFKNSQFLKNIFRLATLSIPFHESSLIHFRQAEISMCDDTANSFKKIKNSMNENSDLKSIYTGFINTLEAPFPKCWELPKLLDSHQKTDLKQIFMSNDLSDMGMMQINFKAHPEFFLRGGIFHLDYTIRYTMEMIAKGLERLSQNAGQYKCLKNPETFHTNLVRSVWASSYNGYGRSERAVCRYNYPDHLYYSNDVMFQKNLKHIINSENSLYRKFLMPTQREQFIKLLSDLEKNSQSYIASLKGYRSKVVKEIASQYALSTDEIFVLNGPKLNIRVGIGADKKKCGTLEMVSSEDPLRFKVLAKSSDDKWLKIKNEGFDEYLLPDQECVEKDFFWIWKNTTISLNSFKYGFGGIINGKVANIYDTKDGDTVIHKLSGGVKVTVINRVLLRDSGEKRYLITYKKREANSLGRKVLKTKSGWIHASKIML